VGNNFASQRRDVLNRARARARKTKIKRVNTERLHQMKNFDLLLDRRIADRRRLQAVAQRFIRQAHRSRQMQQSRVLAVPIVNEFRSVHADFKLFYYSSFTIERSHQ